MKLCNTFWKIDLWKGKIFAERGFEPKNCPTAAGLQVVPVIQVRIFIALEYF